MESIRIGVIGLGNMGAFHAQYLNEGAVARATLAAVADADPRRLAAFGSVPGFERSEDLIRSGQVDAVLVATPHFSHTTIGIDALEGGLHVLIEKPLAPHKADAERLLEAHSDRGQICAVMLNQRVDSRYREVKRLLGSGGLGGIQRIQWTVTDWFRPHIYYQFGGWRATWKGEGGGVLLNQCIHQLDVLQWLYEMPIRVHAFCHLGKYHAIEVEDEVTAYLEYRSRATGVFIASTSEAPGTSRLEIACDGGRIVLEGDRLTVTRNETPVTVFSEQCRDPFGRPEVNETVTIIESDSLQHQQITQNFVDAILDGVPLIAPAAEGMCSVELANAMLYSSFVGSTVDLPLDGKAYESRLQALVAQSKPIERSSSISGQIDMSKSFR